MTVLESLEKIMFKVVPSKGETVEKGDRIPEFRGFNQDGEKVSDENVQNGLIYFYPKAGTSGCTKQACDLRDNVKKLEEIGMEVYGVSVDTVEDQKMFHRSQNLNFDLIADEDGEIAEKFGVMSSAGISERTSFLIEDGKVKEVFRKVAPSEHIDKLENYIEERQD